ncbi:serine/threonine protein kinase [Neorhodopirellula pilleata]|uniref:Serine/threonine-protein kinase Pkn1 n=1 Tax=Neorhodopirellula pilleata TaxID=2714738 RepID=A0A5C6AZ57_9BACT|nr:serine/threonine-protein kinase [Neorhodopirellula pilleata]TWU03424.1 Serine/threonine-protein kinase Pkn1 [Neorhodopirellula pilleata]
MNRAAQRAIFIQAIEEESPQEREAYLQSACGGDTELRAAVDALLAAHDQTQNMLDHPIVGGVRLASTILSSPIESIEHIGMKIGPYLLMEQIGEGGFGLVFVAQQESPVRRKVALKIVKPSMGSKEVIARFEAERQAIAMMNHPNIAQVFDAGVTGDGRPYFVMELVRGVPITEFCDNHRLEINARLNIFSDVCGAVHHAHQKGVIHRDIKPSNVMVTLHDDKPVVKVIDFGVAKAIGQSLTDKTIYTRFFSMIGTPLYMSPEQAEMSGLDVDTRSDIYSLGVLLYELMAGATPFDRERLDSAGLDEWRRIIREEEPPRPSQRLTTLGERMTTISSSRRVEPSRLSSTLRGDVDWIVMRSLEKDRSRRYPSAIALADDVRRYLRQEPIEARPPSTIYRLSKFARRYRVALATATLILLILTGGLAASVWQMRRAVWERDQKEAALHEVESFAEKVTIANELVARGESLAGNNQLDAAEAAFDEAVSQQPSYYLPWVSRGQYFARQQRWSEAADDFAEALKLGAATDTPQWWGVPALFELSDNDQATTQYFKRFSERLSEVFDNGRGNEPLESELESAGTGPVASSTTSEAEQLRWEWIRNGLISGNVLSDQHYQQLAEWTDRVLALPHRGPGPPEPGPPEPGTRGRGPRDSETRRDPSRREPPPRPNDRRPPPRDDGFLGGPNPSPLDLIVPLPRPVQIYISGLAHLRAGDNERAIERFETAAEMRWPNPFLLHAPLAMAYASEGKKDEAREQLKQAHEIADELQAQTGTTDRFAGAPWFDLAEFEVLQAEANHRLRQ